MKTRSEIICECYGISKQEALDCLADWREHGATVEQLLDPRGKRLVDDNWSPPWAVAKKKTILEAIAQFNEAQSD